ncbi:hypothetical protein [Anaerostipes sp.]|uniref:hypothetical protein n=1 Tax=Anaerostipes sp. TaxID=1872530 RepID=UPI0025C1CCB3|nr:hypothetical protein [Anaerostipes sp.]MBS7007038.1 hypothetical protein [Anaerostipes sp.]
MEINILNLIYDFYMENEKDMECVKIANRNFEEYLSGCGEISLCIKQCLSDKKSDYGAECKRQGFYDGFSYAVKVLKGIRYI